MALLNEAVSEQSSTDEEKHSAAMKLKEQGNEYFKKGKKYYYKALNFYSRAIDKKALNDAETSVLYSNSAQVDLLLGNYRRALKDAEEAIKLSPTNVKAHYRAVKASFSLNLLDEAKSFCDKGLEMSPEYEEELKTLAKQIDSMKLHHEEYGVEIANAVADAKRLVSAFEDRGLKIGKPVWKQFHGTRNPTLDERNFLHWPVFLFYHEATHISIIEDFCETDMFSTHLDAIFSVRNPVLPWDTEKIYTRDSVELFYDVYAGPCLPKKEIMRQLLEGTVASHLEDFGDEETGDVRKLSATGIPDFSKWFKIIDENTTLGDHLKKWANSIIAGIPVIHVRSKKKSAKFDKLKPGLNFSGLGSG